MFDVAEMIVDQRPSDFDVLLDQVLAEIGAMLKRKNRAYGNSALEPMRVFSRANLIEQLDVRIDDKLSRIAKGQAAGEDVEIDLIGYLVIKRIAVRLAVLKGRS